jgi:hypothetical protein
MGQLERIRTVEDDLRVRILTCEAEILFFLRDMRAASFKTCVRRQNTPTSPSMTIFAS